MAGIRMRQLVDRAAEYGHDVSADKIKVLSLEAMRGAYEIG